MERVLITGLGTISCLGRGVEAHWRGLLAATSMPREISDPHAHMARRSLYLVTDDSFGSTPAELDGVPMGRTARLAVDAAHQAVGNAKLVAPDDGPRPRVAVVVGTAMGGSDVNESWRVGRGRAAAGAQQQRPAFDIACAIGRSVNAAGVNTSISNACAASGCAIAMGADLIRADLADVVIAGGADSYSRVALGCFNRLGAVDPIACRPFSAARQGTVLGEGAAMMVLESSRHAAGRSAPAPYAVLAGSGWSCDAYHATAPEPEGRQIARAMRAAFDDAGLRPDRPGVVVPHGTGTELNDVVESRAILEVVREHRSRAPVYSLKALLGHTGGASAALGTATAALILSRKSVPANIPGHDPDHDCPLWLPQGEYVGPPEWAMVNAYAFGGNNVSLMLGRAA